MPVARLPSNAATGLQGWLAGAGAVATAIPSGIATPLVPPTCRDTGFGTADEGLSAFRVRCARLADQRDCATLTDDLQSLSMLMSSPSSQPMAALLLARLELCLREGWAEAVGSRLHDEIDAHFSVFQKNATEETRKIGSGKQPQVQ